MTDTDTTPGASEPSGGSVEAGSETLRDDQIPPEALEPSGRSEESLPTTAPSPARRDPMDDPEDGSTELPPVTLDI